LEASRSGLRLPGALANSMLAPPLSQVSSMGGKSHALESVREGKGIKGKRKGVSKKKKNKKKKQNLILIDYQQFKKLILLYVPALLPF
jgi:hypothetical protein